MAHDVFVCYSSEDKTIANAACAKLESAGIRCWIAPRDPIPGIPYGRQLVDAIGAARVVLLIFSGNANRSEHVLRELEVASDGGKIIVPFRIENVVPSGDLKYYITRVHWLDAMSPPMETRLNELVAMMQRLLDLPVVAPPASAPAVQPRKMTGAYIAGAAAIVVVAIAAALAFSFNRPRTAVVSHAVARATAQHRKAAPKPTPAHATMVAVQPTPRLVYVAGTAAPVATIPKHAIMRARSTPAARVATHAPTAVKTIAPTMAPVVQTQAPTSLAYRLPRGNEIRVSRLSADSWRVGTGSYTTVGRASIAGTSGTTLSSPRGAEWFFIPDIGANGPYAHQVCFSTAGPGICDANKIFPILTEQ
ncbi:MAG TPA: TIR domain-containing protein [Candidatus Rubrimentiphilum sp.]|nr:TIR domain-containing protein [Candidatus Rubrimentiphilum sp.]